MSKATKMKHVTRHVLEDYDTPSDTQSIVKIVCGRGNNLHEVESIHGETYLVTMPTRFRKNVWIKRGDYVIVEPIEEGRKVQAEIVHILYPKQIKEMMRNGVWPVQFTVKNTRTLSTHANTTSDSEDELFMNTNRLCSKEQLSDTDSQ